MSRLKAHKEEICQGGRIRRTAVLVYPAKSRFSFFLGHTLPAELSSCEVHPIIERESWEQTKIWIPSISLLSKDAQVDRTVGAQGEYELLVLFVGGGKCDAT